VTAPSMRVVAWDPGPRWSGWCLAEMTAASRGRPVFVDGGKVRSIPEEIHRIIGRAGAGSVVGVETPTGYVHQHARGAALLETARVAGEIVGAARYCGHHVVEMAASSWRRALCGNGSAPDCTIARAVAMLATGLPVRTNVHLRDALGLAIVVFRHPAIAARRLA
jgi:Holliday junction resolvasome RuvABC endonuclease subunit